MGEKRESCWRPLPLGPYAGFREGSLWQPLSGCVERLVLAVIFGQVLEVDGVVVLRVPIVGDEPSQAAARFSRSAISSASNLS